MLKPHSECNLAQMGGLLRGKMNELRVKITHLWKYMDDEMILLGTKMTLQAMPNASTAWWSDYSACS